MNIPVIPNDANGSMRKARPDASLRKIDQNDPTETSGEQRGSARMMITATTNAAASYVVVR
jgi:hypothetical protein